MNYSATYTYDIFISYAHVDNLPVFNQEQGWIEQFYEDLRILLVQRLGRIDDVRIWWDEKRLDGGTFFDQSIEEGIRRTAVMLSLLSPGYMKSDYCQKELDAFYQKVQGEEFGLKVGDRSRLLNVLLYNIPPKKWPAALGGTSGFPFYDADSKEDWGNPLEVDDPRFRKQLNDLKETLVNLIEEMREPAPVPPPAFSIYFGDVADSLRTVRKRTIAELEKQGYAVICDVPPPFEKEEHERAVKEEMEGAILNVHLLDQFPGREIEGEETLWYPQTQVEIGLQTEKPQLIWVPAETNIDLIEEEQYKSFIASLESGKQAARKIDFVRGAKSELTQQIVDLVEHLKKEQEQLKSEDLAPVADMAVLLDTHAQDQVYAWRVGETLLEHGIKAYLNPVEDDPRLNANTLEERISKVNKLVFFYGKVTWDWVRGRMTMALQSIVSNLYPVEEFIVFMVPPHKDPKDLSLKQWVLKVNVVNNSDTPQLDVTSLQPFIQSLKKHPA